MKSKSIDLGYVPMEGYTSKTPLNPEWQFPGHEYYEKGDELKNVDEKDVVLQRGTYDLVITYPLTTPFHKLFTVDAKGMTRRKLVNLIVKCYKKIYHDEDKAVGGETDNIPGMLNRQTIPGMLNRQTSEGPYGIWGHCLGDLMLHTARVDRMTITIGCDS
jgi:hypothetical protein